MVSTEEIDWAIKILGYVMAYVDGEFWSEKLHKNYDAMEEYWHKEPQSNHSIGIISESDGQIWWFDQESFLNDVNFLIEDNIIKKI